MQKGFPELKIASLFDYELMKIAQKEAAKLASQDSNLDKWPKLKEKLEMLNNTVHLE